MIEGIICDSTDDSPRSHVLCVQSTLFRLFSVSARKIEGYGGIILYYTGKRNFCDTRCIAKIIDIIYGV